MHILSARETRLEAARRRKVAEIICFFAIFAALLPKEKERKRHRVRPRTEDGSVSSQLACC